MAFDNNIELNGMVLSSKPVGEYDLRITLLTKEKGKISAFSRGARKPKSSLMAGSRPFSYGKFTIFMGRNSNVVSSIEIENYFENISKDISATYYGFYFLELADYYSKENIEAKEMLQLLYQSLRALMNEKIPNRLVRCIYELKILVYNGEYPEVFSCINCGEENELKSISISKGGMICTECEGSIPDTMKIDISTVYTMQYVVSSDIKKLYTFLVSENVLCELEKILRQYYSRYIDKSFKSLEIITMLEYNTRD